MTRSALLALAIGCTAACAAGQIAPAAIDTRNDACAHCRMIISDVKLAAQIVAPGEEPVLFDDIGCLRAHMQASAPASDAVVYVADHRTGQWIDATRAIYTRVSTLSTPMASGIVAHADAASRDADPAAAGGMPIEPQLARSER